MVKTGTRKRQYFRKDRRSWTDAAKNNDLILIYETTRRLVGKYARAGMLVKSKDGTLLTNESKQLLRWDKH